MSTEYSTANTATGNSNAGRKAIIRATGSYGWGENVRLGFFTTDSKYNYPVERMIISPSGNVGIGKMTPTTKLHVGGNIISSEIKVENVIGADFVFAPAYNLMSLSQIDAYIKQNHHLPEVPSAVAMEANGIDMLLLQKIEELTLLMIEQQKENIEQKAINKSQQIQLEILKNEIDEKFNK